MLSSNGSVTSIGIATVAPAELDADEPVLAPYYPSRDVVLELSRRLGLDTDGSDDVEHFLEWDG